MGKGIIKWVLGGVSIDGTTYLGFCYIYIYACTHTLVHLAFVSLCWNWYETVDCIILGNSGDVYRTLLEEICCFLGKFGF